MQIPDLNKINYQQGLGMPTGGEWLVIILVMIIPIIIMIGILYAIILWIKNIKLQNKIMESKNDNSK